MISSSSRRVKKQLKTAILKVKVLDLQSVAKNVFFDVSKLMRAQMTMADLQF